MRDEPGPSSETRDWAINVKFEEDDPLDISLPVVKTEPVVSCTFMCRIASRQDDGKCPEL
jgi:hypothetical protein